MAVFLIYGIALTPNPNVALLLDRMASIFMDAAVKSQHGEWNYGTITAISTKHLPLIISGFYIILVYKDAGFMPTHTGRVPETQNILKIRFPPQT